jgi:hypothetical protein
MAAEHDTTAEAAARTFCEHPPLLIGDEIGDVRREGE